LPGPDTAPNDNTHQGTGGAVITSVEIQRWNSATRQWDDIRTHPVSLDDAEDPPTAYTTTSLTHTDTDVDDGTGYTYRVRAVNEAGGSDWTMSTSTTDDTAPDMPVLSATVNGQDIVLSWTAPDNNGAPITRYEIQRFPSIDNDGVEQNVWGDDIGSAGRDGETGGDFDADNDPSDDSNVIVPMPAGVTTHTDMDLKPGTTYYYRIRAVNTNNTERPATNPGWSTEVQATTAPMAPDRMTLTLAGGEEKITLTWEAPKNNGSPISEYQIERWSIVSRSWQLIKDQLPVSVTTYEETGLAEGTRYFFRIRAVNAGGEGAWSTLTSAVTDAAAE
jgi:predicted phage tail protein